MTVLRVFAFVLFCSLVLTGTKSSVAADEKNAADLPVLGYIENVWVGNLRLKMKGKLDTGAESSSVHAYDMELYEREPGNHWVKFRLMGADGRWIKYDQNVIGFANIKLKTGGTLRRPVIRIPLCIDGIMGRAEVNLADREEFLYDMLIGREFLAKRILVDSGKFFLAKNKRCRKQ